MVYKIGMNQLRPIAPRIPDDNVDVGLLRGPNSESTINVIPINVDEPSNRRPPRLAAIIPCQSCNEKKTSITLTYWFSRISLFHKFAHIFFFFYIRKNLFKANVFQPIHGACIIRGMQNAFNVETRYFITLMIDCDINFIHVFNANQRANSTEVSSNIIWKM